MTNLLASKSDLDQSERKSLQVRACPDLTKPQVDTSWKFAFTGDGLTWYSTELKISCLSPCYNNKSMYNHRPLKKTAIYYSQVVHMQELKDKYDKKEKVMGLVWCYIGPTVHTILPLLEYLGGRLVYRNVHYNIYKLWTSLRAGSRLGPICEWFTREPARTRAWFSKPLLTRAWFSRLSPLAHGPQTWSTRSELEMKFTVYVQSRTWERVIISSRLVIPREESRIKLVEIYKS